MARNLFIRVSAVTYDEVAVRKTWPKLCALVWPDDAPGASSVLGGAPGTPARGVLELAAAFEDYAGFADMDKAKRAALEPFAQKLSALRAMLEAALGDRAVQRAHDLTNAIEDCLDDAEKNTERP